MSMALPTGRPTDRSESDHTVSSEDEALTPMTLGQVAPAQDRVAGSFGRSSLSDRELEVLTTLGTLRLATGIQLQRLCVADGSPQTQARRTRALLQNLSKRNLVVRLDRRVGGVRAGSSGYVYGLSGRGQAAIGIGGPNGGRRRRVWEIKPAFLDHVIAVAELYCSIIDGTRGAAFELLNFYAEPAAWRTFPGPSGELIRLKPDAFVRLGVGEYERSSFVEVDLATEGTSTLHRKCMTYLAYLRSGLEQTRYGVFPSVAWLTTTEQRASRIAAVLKRLPDEAERIFSVSLLTDAVTTLTTTAVGGRMA